MGTVYLVRHGQASFGAANYDLLSERGHQQCRRLGQYLAERGLRFDAVQRGSLVRHEESLAALAEGYGSALPPVEVDSAWNEYDSLAVVRTVHPGPLPAPTTAEAHKQHFHLLRRGLSAWMDGSGAPEGMPSHAEFAAAIRRQLDELRERRAGHVLVLSSGGPISCAAVQVLGAPAATAIELNLRMRNSALTELVTTARGYALHTFNHLPHLESAEHVDWETYT